MSINKVWLEHRHIHLHIVSSCFSTTTAKSSNWNRDLWSAKSKMFIMRCFIKSLPTFDMRQVMRGMAPSLNTERHNTKNAHPFLTTQWVSNGFPSKTLVRSPWSLPLIIPGNSHRLPSTYYYMPGIIIFIIWMRKLMINEWW